jgi:glycosyltransferase involved in cell wall biosynthesis
LWFYPELLTAYRSLSFSNGSREMPKVVHLSTVHQPFDNRIFHRECKTLSDAGYQVVLVIPNVRNEVVDGVRIRAVPKPRTRLERMLMTAWQVFRIALDENGDCYHFHDPELIPIGVLLKLYGKRVVYDVHEELPMQLLGKYYLSSLRIRKMMSRFARLTERIGASFFDGIVVANPITATRFPKKKTIIVRNFPSSTELRTADPLSFDKRPPWVFYVGDISVLRGIKEMVEAIGLVPKELDPRLVLAGKFSPPELESEMRQIPGWERADFVGFQSRVGMAQILAKSRVGLVVLHPTPNYKVSTAWKMFEYMSAGVPVVASDFPLWREIIIKADCGILVDPLDPKAVADAIAWLLQHPADAERMGRNGLAAVREKYHWATQAEKLKELYARLLAGEKTRSDVSKREAVSSEQ